ncbi:MAG: hypothetical protein QXK06_04370 [Candidatus Diapherotrites archaeon]
MAKKTVALSIEEKIYNNYKEHCDKEGIVLSRQVEKFMEKELANNLTKK